MLALTASSSSALGVGLAQASALVQGVSRSGATITLGLFLGPRREESARFSFLMSVPVEQQKRKAHLRPGQK